MTHHNDKKITMRGNPLTLAGNFLKVGDKAPEFTVHENLGQKFTLKDLDDKIKIFNVVISVDTPVCDKQTRKFNEEAIKLTEDVQIVTFSMDLPFALKRYCGAANIDRVKAVSDYFDASFGIAYGTLIEEYRLLARALFVIDKNNIIKHVEYVDEITHEPNYEASLQIVNELT